MAEHCRDIEPLLSAWLDDELAAPERAAVSPHLARCADCRRSVEALRVTRSLLRSVPVRRSPVDTASEPARPAGRTRVAVARAATAAALGLGMLVGTAYALGGEPETNAPVVRVPMELYVVDHLMHSAGSVIVSPGLVEEQP